MLKDRITIVAVQNGWTVTFDAAKSMEPLKTYVALTPDDLATIIRQLVTTEVQVNATEADAEALSPNQGPWNPHIRAEAYRVEPGDRK